MDYVRGIVKKENNLFKVGNHYIFSYSNNGKQYTIIRALKVELNEIVGKIVKGVSRGNTIQLMEVYEIGKN